MFCFRARKHLIPYSEGTLDERRRDAVARHLAECESCADELAFIQKACVAFRGAKIPAQEPAPDLWPRIERQIAAPAPAVQRWRVSGLQLTGAAAAAVLILFAVVNVSRLGAILGRPEQPSAPSKASEHRSAPTTNPAAGDSAVVKLPESPVATHSYDTRPGLVMRTVPVAPPPYPALGAPAAPSPGRTAEPSSSASYYGSPAAGAPLPSAPPALAGSARRSRDWAGGEGSAPGSVIDASGPMGPSDAGVAARPAGSARLADEDKVKVDAAAAAPPSAAAEAADDKLRLEGKLATGPRATGSPLWFGASHDRSVRMANGALGAPPTSVDLMNSVDTSTRTTALFSYP